MFLTKKRIFESHVRVDGLDSAILPSAGAILRH